MKKLLLISRVLPLGILMCLMCNDVAGQAVTLTKGNESKDVEDEDVLNSSYLGGCGSQSYWLTKEDDRGDDWSVYSVDRNMRVKKWLRLPVDENYELVAIAQDGSVASVIMVDSSSNKRTMVIKFSVDMDSMSLVEGKIDTIGNFALDKGDRCYVWGAVSGNGDYVGLLTLQQFTKKKQYVAVATMYDRGLEEQWRKEFPVGSTSCIAVTDQGELLTLGGEREKTAERFLVSVIAAGMGESYAVTVTCDRIQDMRILNVMGRKMICAGVFSPLESDPEDHLVAGTAMMVFDLDSTNITGFTLYPFQNEDVAILQNKKTKKVMRDKVVPMVVPLASTPMPYGAVMAVGHRHLLRYKNANGTVSTTYYAQGIHLVAIDENGGVKWVRNIRRNDYEKEEDGLMYVGLFDESDTVCLLKSECPKYPSDYNIAKEAKEYEMGDKGNLVLYRVAENGDVMKTTLEQKTKHMLVSAAKCEDGKVLMMTQKGNKSRLVEMGF